MRQQIWAATAIAAQQMKTPLSRATLALAAQCHYIDHEHPNQDPLLLRF
jgi:hypothetical protein